MSIFDVVVQLDFNASVSIQQFTSVPLSYQFGQVVDIKPLGDTRYLVKFADTASKYIKAVCNCY